MKVHEDWFVYLLRCRDSTLYCGVTNNIDRRLAAHNTGRGARYTRSRRPVALAAVSPALPKRAAFRLEYRIKQLPAGLKEAALQEGDSHLQAIAVRHGLLQFHSALAALARRLDDLIATL